MIPVTCVRCDGEAVLVEWQVGDDFCRGTIPCSACKQDKVSQEDLDAAVPYGLCWESLLELTVTAETVGKELRRRGIWTAVDLEASFNAACQGVRGLHDREMVALLRAAQEAK